MKEMRPVNRVKKKTDFFYNFNCEYVTVHSNEKLWIIAAKKMELKL